MDHSLVDAYLQVALSILVGLFAVIWFFYRDKLRSQDRKIATLFTKIDELAALVKSDPEIIAVINGRYVSRREMDLLLSERTAWREQLNGRLSLMDGVSERVRKFKDHDYGSNRQSDIARIALVEIEIAKIGVVLGNLGKKS